LTALKYSPKYTVIWERDPEKSYRVQIDYIPGGVDNRDESDKVKYRTYDAFKKSLPIEEGKAVKGEIE